jgi:MFS family permease
MENLILGWYILVETGSVVMLTLFGALLFVGTLIAPMLGVFGDRIGQRYLLTAMRVVYAGCAVTLTSLAIAGILSPLYVFMVAAVMGLVRPSDMGVRGALVGATMPHEELVGAIGTSRVTSDSARIVGALAGAGLFAFFGMVPAYIAITCFYVLGAVLTFMTGPEVRHQPAEGTAPASHWRDLREGIVYVWTTPKVLAAMWIAFLANLTAFPILNGLLPYVAKEVYRIDQTGLGYLIASFAFGAMIGSVAMSTFGDRYRLERVMLLSTAAWYVMMLAFAHIDTMYAGMLCLLFAGTAQSLSMIAVSVILLRGAGVRFRGRVMGVRMLAIYGLPVGLLIAGALIGRIGFGATAMIYGTIGLVFTLVIALLWRADVWHAPELAGSR